MLILKNTDECPRNQITKHAYKIHKKNPSNVSKKYFLHLLPISSKGEIENFPLNFLFYTFIYIHKNMSLLSH